MIPATTLARSGITTSRLAFGTSRLHHIGRRDRQRLLSLAAELGILHFDTAPAYGDGLAEAELGLFLRGQRNRFIIATKYGLPANRLIAKWPLLALPLRAARTTLRGAGLIYRSQLPPLTANGLRISVQQSLWRLRTDYIDLLLLHEPQIARIPAPQEIMGEFARLQQAGVIRAFGLAGAWEGIKGILAIVPELGMVVQTAEDDWPADTIPDITYGTMALGPQSYFPRSISTVDALVKLRRALARRPSGAVIISTSKYRHLNALSEIFP